MIRVDEYFMGRDVGYVEELTEELRANAAETVRRVNLLLQDYVDTAGHEAPGLRSGWRPSAVNSRIRGASKNSKHITCQAIDLSDLGHRFSGWCLKNLHLLEERELWMESPESTPTWCHLQTVSPKSGHRVFLP